MTPFSVNLQSIYFIPRWAVTLHHLKCDRGVSPGQYTLFTRLNSHGQLRGWQANGGDPCGHSWQGITCSGSGVTKM